VLWSGVYSMVQDVYTVQGVVGKSGETSSMVLTTPALETKPSGDVSYLGVQPVGSMSFIS